MFWSLFTFKPKYANIFILAKYVILAKYIIFAKCYFGKLCYFGKICYLDENVFLTLITLFLDTVLYAARTEKVIFNSYFCKCTCIE